MDHSNYTPEQEKIKSEIKRKIKKRKLEDLNKDNEIGNFLRFELLKSEGNLENIKDIFF